MSRHKTSEPAKETVPPPNVPDIDPDLPLPPAQGASGSPTTSFFLSADYVYLQRAGRFKDAGVDFEDYVVTAAVAAEWRPWDWLGMTVQLDVLTNIIADTGVMELDDPQVLGSLGMSFVVSEHARFRLGFSEDMTSAASADFAVYGGLTWRF